MQEKTISIAIPTYNRDRALVDTIEQVLLQRHFLLEILVIDQSESHVAETEKYLNRKIDSGEIRYIFQSHPNLPAARNRALKETKADILIFIDDDVVLGKNFVEEHWKNYRDDTVAAVAGKVTQRLSWSQIRKPKMWNKYLDYRYFSLESDNRVAGVANFLGCNHSILVRLAKLLGGYDDNYVGTGLREETDMAIRLVKAGHMIIYNPLSALYHLAAPSGGCRKAHIYDDTAGRSLLYFAVKHLDVLKLDVFYDFKLAFRVMVLNRQNIKRPFVLLYMAWKYISLFVFFLLKRAGFYNNYNYK